MPKRTDSRSRPDRPGEGGLTPPQSVLDGGPSDLEVFLASQRLRLVQRFSDRELGELSDRLFDLEVRSGMDPEVCAAVDGLMAALEAAT